MYASQGLFELNENKGPAEPHPNVGINYTLSTPGCRRRKFTVKPVHSACDAHPVRKWTKSTPPLSLEYE
ncbi:hypothetical protein J6590_055732 [Homalodisca vitripennis]|nr:hypothetical protein J6590_055732 [Homalodisca vitripennis]